jgi:RNA polymerase primary sigma factor
VLDGPWRSNLPPYTRVEEGIAFRKLDELRRQAKKLGSPESKLAVVRQRNVIMERNLGLVWSQAMFLVKRAKHLDVEDLFGFGIEGVMKAIDKFEVERGYKFSTYSTWWVRQAMTRAIADMDLLVRIPVHLRELKAKVAKAEEALMSEHGAKPPPGAIASRARVKTAKVHSADRVSLGAAYSLNAPPGNTDDGEELTFMDLLRAPTFDPVEEITKTERATLAHSLLGTLNERERDIITARCNGQTLSDVGKALGRTRERIRQIESKALAKLRRVVEYRRAIKPRNLVAL